MKIKVFVALVMLMMCSPLVLIAHKAFGPLEPLKTYNVACLNGSAALRATSMHRQSSGVIYFSDIEGQRSVYRSFPPDCFVTVAP